MGIKWNKENASHLLRRAGFAATDKSVKKALGQGLKKTVDKLLKPDKSSDAWPIELELNGVNSLSAWWVRRMLRTKRPLVEKLTAFWHNHFATSIDKVEILELMHGQNRTLRANALGKFRDMLLAVSRDPAMILWLDNDTNIAANPNENYARELMELFSTGVYDKNGNANYTETDIQESARAFTGWTIGGDYPNYTFFHDDDNHDFSSKTFKGHTGNFDGEDIVDLLAEDPATARRIAMKLWSFFAYEVALDDPVLDKIAKAYIDSDTSIKAVLKEIFTTPAFYSSDAKNSRVKNPVEFYVGSLQYLGAALPEENDEYSWVGTYTEALGMSLFQPPSVFGWKEGLKWIETSGLLERLKLADFLADLRDPSDIITWDLRAFLGGDKKIKKLDANGLVNVILSKLGPMTVSASTRSSLVTYVLADEDGNPNAFDPNDEDLLDAKARGLIAVVMSLPEFQIH